jgi:hypothetical protein
MSMRVSGESRTQETPDAGAAKVPEPNSVPDRGAVPPDTAVGKTASEEAWAAWEAKGRGSSRPPWWLLLLGLLGLSAVYWLWGRGIEVTPVRLL